jgi:Na+/H+ antiporter NhaC
VDLPPPFPLLLALAPAIVAIATALMARRVVPALLAGVITGAAVANLDALANGHVITAFEALGGFLLEAVIPGAASFRLDLRGEGNLLFGALSGDLGDLNWDHLIITAFSLTIAVMVGILGRSGGTRALVRGVERLAHGPRGAQVAAWLAGFIVFFDDYANCLVVGSAMGPVFDRFRVSRAKLAFIVDCTAAPVASLALVSTWVGYEIGLIGSELDKVGSDLSPLGLFIEALPYAFYAVAALALVGAVAIMGRDYGPMLAEEEAARGGAELTDPGPPTRWPHALAAVIPVVTLIGAALGGLWIDGSRRLAGQASTAPPTWLDVLAAADPFQSLLWASLIAAGLAAILAVMTGGLPLRRLPTAIWGGLKPVLPAITVLFLAWGLGNAMEATRAAEHLTELARPSTTFSFVGAPVHLPYTPAGKARRVEFRVVDDRDRVVHRGSALPTSAGDQRYTWNGDAIGGGAARPGRYRLDVTATDAEGAPIGVLIRAEERFAPWLLPAVVFVVAAATAFATGTSFGTMAILIPLVVPLGLSLQGGEVGPVLLASLAAVLSGAIMGDHASPISDTTVLSALGAGVDLMTHVRTQLPYALTAGVVALLFGFVPAGLGVNPWLLLAACVGAVALFVRVVGRHPRPPPPPEPLITLAFEERASDYEAP